MSICILFNYNIDYKQSWEKLTHIIIELSAYFHWSLVKKNWIWGMFAHKYAIHGKKKISTCWRQWNRLRKRKRDKVEMVARAQHIYWHAKQQARQHSTSCQFEQFIKRTNKQFQYCRRAMNVLCEWKRMKDAIDFVCMCVATTFWFAQLLT